MQYEITPANPLRLDAPSTQRPHTPAHAAASPGQSPGNRLLQTQIWLLQMRTLGDLCTLCRLEIGTLGDLATADEDARGFVHLAGS